MTESLNNLAYNPRLWAALIFTGLLMGSCTWGGNQNI